MWYKLKRRRKETSYEETKEKDNDDIYNVTVSIYHDGNSQCGKKTTLLGTSNRYYYTIRQKIRSIVINCHYIIFRRAKKSQKLKAAMKKLQPYIVVSTEKKKQ